MKRRGKIGKENADKKIFSTNATWWATHASYQCEIDFALSQQNAVRQGEILHEKPIQSSPFWRVLRAVPLRPGVQKGYTVFKATEACPQRHSGRCYIRSIPRNAGAVPEYEFPMTFL